MKTFFRIIKEAVSFIILIIIYEILKNKDTTPIDTNRLYKDEDARYFKWCRPQIFIESPIIYGDECTLKEARENGKYSKAWFNEKGRMLKFITFGYDKELSMEYQYNASGQLVKIIYFDENGVVRDSRSV